MRHASVMNRCWRASSAPSACWPGSRSSAVRTPSSRRWRPARRVAERCSRSRAGRTIRCATRSATRRNALVHDGIEYREVPLLDDGGIDLDAVAQALTPPTSLRFRAAVARLRAAAFAFGRAMRSGLRGDQTRAPRRRSSSSITATASWSRNANRYAAGADLIMGSLIKNFGGSIAPAGAYVAGRADLVERVAARLYAPGLGGALGPTLGFGRALLQGLFLRAADRRSMLARTRLCRRALRRSSAIESNRGRGDAQRYRSGDSTGLAAAAFAFRRRPAASAAGQRALSARARSRARLRRPGIHVERRVRQRRDDRVIVRRADAAAVRRLRSRRASALRTPMLGALFAAREIES